MRVVIIGGSGHYSFALDGLAQDPSLTFCAVAPGTPGENLDGLLAACRNAGFSPRLYGDARAMLDAERPDVAAVNPWFCDNAAVSMDCLRRGIHVYSEKPLATDLGALAELAEVWRHSGAALGGMFNLRLSPWFLAAEEAIREGAVGEVRLLHGQKSYKLGQRGMPYRKRAAYGGLIPWVGVHAIDWVLRLGGACQWVSASQSMRCNRDHEELEVSAAVLLGLENEVIATVTADYLRPDGSARHDDDRLRVTGTRGMLEAVDGRVFLENEQPRRELALPEPIQPFLRFTRAISTPLAEEMAREALESSRVSLLARDAADQGRRLSAFSAGFAWEGATHES